jgi:hypothetical protein
MYKPLILLLTLLACVSAARAQGDDEARGIFIRTRKNSVAQKPNSPPARRTTRPTRSTRRRPPAPAQAAVTGNAQSLDSPQRFVGVGYTLYLKNDDGRFLSVSPRRVFHTGEAVRLLVESNVDGYLYVLHQENDGPPQMMFPCSLAWGGDNHIWAHRPLFISPVTEIQFTGNPATETLTLIVSRSPLPSLPLGRDLPAGHCHTQLSELALNSILRRPCQCGRDERVAEGQAMPRDTLSRDMEMVASDPAPSHIVVNRDALDDIVITRVALTHR